MTVDAVVFDIGNVLIEWVPERFYDKTVGETRRRAMFGAVDLHGLNDRVDRGERLKHVMYAAAETYPEFRTEIRMWHDNWFDMATPRIEHSVRLLRALRAKGVPVFALTNFGVDTFANARKVYEFLNEFDRYYVSGEMKVIKPEPQIYEMLETDCGIAPSKLLFADDRVDNINAAARRGWQTHLFEHAQGWADRLVTENLLTSAEAH